MSVNNDQIAVVLIFLVTYAFIVSEKIHRSIVAMISALLVISFGFLEQNQAIEYIDFNTIILLIGMMVIVVIAKKSGLFEFMAIKIIKISRGNPFIIFFSFIFLTAIFSAFLDNVTTVLFMIPISFLVINLLKIPAYPFIMGEIFASNIGGTATLIGDPPNILIGSKNNISFNEFLANLGPVAIIVLFVTVFFLYLKYRKDFPFKNRLESIKGFDESKSVKDKKMMIASVIVIVLVLAGFIISEHVGIEPGSIALFCATILMLYSKKDPGVFLEYVEWNTLFFLMGLFILVGSLEHSGILEEFARKIVGLTDNRLYLCIIILWASGIVSSFLDNIPFVLTMIPILQSVIGPGNLDLTRSQSMPVWWALALGACFGGNGSLVGASANIVVEGLTNKFQPGLITFKSFLKLGFTTMLISLIISTIFLDIVFFR